VRCVCVQVKVGWFGVCVWYVDSRWLWSGQVSMDRVQVQAARLPSPDNPFKAETNDAATSPQGQALKVYMSELL
jgi:hypothetical protein